MALISIFRRPIFSVYGLLWQGGSGGGRSRGGGECVAMRCASGNQHEGPGRLGVMAMSLSPSLGPEEEDDTRGGFKAGVVSSSSSTSDGGDGGGDGGVAWLALGRQQQQDGMSREGRGPFLLCL